MGTPVAIAFISDIGWQADDTEHLVYSDVQYRFQDRF